MSEEYGKKTIISGKFVELYEYQYPIKKGRKGGFGRSGKASNKDKQKNRETTLRRARGAIRRLVNSNIENHGDATPKFVTLTFKDNITDLKDANYEFKKFRQRLEYNFNIRLAYLCVPEFQKRGAVHYHVIFFNLPYILVDDLYLLWENGFVKINKIEHVDNVGAYVSKYLSKEKADERLEGEKCYFCSRSLLKPLTLEDEEVISEIMDNFDEDSFRFEQWFENEHVGVGRYRLYVLSD